MLKDKGQLYGNEEQMHEEISQIATLLLNKSISTYDVAMIHVATKLARMKNAREHYDSYVDAINYLAFAAQFANRQDTIIKAMENDLINLTRDLPKNSNKDMDDEEHQVVNSAL